MGDVSITSREIDRGATGFGYDSEGDLGKRREDLKDVDAEWGVKRDESRDGNKSALIYDEEWLKIKSYNTWGTREM